MCTVSWLTHESGYEVLFNRDERKVRQKALPPSVLQTDEIAYIAPTDPEGGGSWLSANAYGVTIGLLNNYIADESGFSGKAYLSRGLLVSALAASQTWANAIARLQAIDLNQYQPFHILVFVPQEQVLLFNWDGCVLSRQNGPQSPVISSSFDPENVLASRLACFQQSAESESLLDIHRSHRPNQSAYSVCMHRDDAQTVSFSHIVVNASEVGFHYSEGAPCREPVTVSVCIDRAPVNGSRVA